jgi:hypothetical protein
VRSELERGIRTYPELADVLAAEWCLDSRTRARDDETLLREAGALAPFAQRLVADNRHLGEAATLAWAQVHGAIAIVDDLAARAVGEAAGIEVHGSMWLVFVRGVHAGILSRSEAEKLIDALLATGHRLPGATRADVFLWAEARGLLW